MIGRVAVARDRVQARGAEAERGEASVGVAARNHSQRSRRNAIGPAHGDGMIGVCKECLVQLPALEEFDTLGPEVTNLDGEMPGQLALNREVPGANVRRAHAPLKWIK